MAKDHLEESLRVAQEEVNRFNGRYVQEMTEWQKERKVFQEKLG